jgi:hypothetical protein
MSSIEEANAAIVRLSQLDRRQRAARSEARRRMRHLDRLIDELEMLNLAEQAEIPPGLRVVVDRLIEDGAGASGSRGPSTVGEVMDRLFEIQESLMRGGPDEEEQEGERALEP